MGDAEDHHDDPALGAGTRRRARGADGRDTKRSTSYLASGAIASYVEMNAWQVARINAALANARSGAPPRLAQGAPRIPAEGAIPGDPEHMPDTISYDSASRRLRVGGGHVENVPPEVWAYEVSGKQVLTQWFSYRRRNRERPLIGDRRPPSPLSDIQPDRWLAEYTTELLNVLHVLGRLVLLEPAQADLLERICAGPTIDDAALRAE